MRIYIFGPQGVGKTTISKYIANKYKYLQFSSSDIMMRICGANSRDELRNMDVRFKREMEDRYYIKFLETQGDIIVDGHGSLNDEQVKFFDSFIYLICSPEILYERRKSDISRSDRELSIDNIDNDLLVYHKKCNHLELQGAVIHTVDNSSNIENAIIDIESRIESIKAEVGYQSEAENNTY